MGNKASKEKQAPIAVQRPSSILIANALQNARCWEPVREKMIF